MTKRQVEYIDSSGNVFADLKLPNPGELLAKAELTHKITLLVSEKKLTQVQTAKLLGIDQPKVSALLRGRLAGFSLERLIRFLLLLGQEVKISVRPARSRTGSRVRVA
jgi:predicted XRE-type DNA-binding protein